MFPAPDGAVTPSVEIAGSGRMWCDRCPDRATDNVGRETEPPARRSQHSVKSGSLPVRWLVQTRQQILRLGQEFSGLTALLDSRSRVVPVFEAVLVAEGSSRAGCSAMFPAAAFARLRRVLAGGGVPVPGAANGFKRLSWLFSHPAPPPCFRW
jgi:hypothetical protein